MRHYRRILVTGAGGFAGRHVLRQLRESFPAAELIAAVRSEQDEPPPPSHADRIVPFDLQAPSHDEMFQAIRPDGVIHLAAQASVASSFRDPLASWQINLMGTVRFAEALLRHAPQARFVFASSAEVYGLSFKSGVPLTEMAPMCPTNPYAASKAACDLAIGEIALRGLDAVRLRAFNHTGAGQSDKFVVASFARQIAQIEAGLQAPVIEVGALDRWRDFLDVSDVCTAYAAALKAETVAGSVFNIASGTCHRIGDILDSLLRQSVVRPRIEVASGNLRPTDVERVWGDAAQAALTLNWRAVVPWNDTLAEVLRDWRARVALTTL